MTDLDGGCIEHTKTHNGTERHKAEKLASLRVAAGTSGDAADETVVADVLETITVGTQPLTLLHLVVLEHSLLHSQLISLVLIYKWQTEQQVLLFARWVDISASLDTGITYANFTTATLAYSGLAGTTLNGY